MNTLIYIWMKSIPSASEEKREMECEGSFKDESWGMLAALTLGIALVLATSILIFT